MRLLIISDSHGNSFAVDKIIRENPECEHIFFLGDKTPDIEDAVYEYTSKKFHIVKGNCDGFCSYPDYDIIRLNGIDILYCHGYTFGVKFGTSRLYEAALNANCKIALYGHTHIAKSEYIDGIYLVNPGSCSRPREGGPTYAVIEIRENGILVNIKKE